MDGFAGRLGVHDVDGEEGQARLELDAGDEHLNPAGTVHGGVLATLADAAMGAAARSALHDDTVTTSQLTIVYLRPARPGKIVAVAQIRKQGDHLLVCDVEVEQEGKTVVHGVATFAILEH
jgi:uncharacterized protein (TIGR00369 family)